MANPKKPAEIKKLHGTYKPHRDAKGFEPSTERPEPPEWINEEAKEAFCQLVERLEPLGMASSTYTEMIALAASALEIIWSANRWIERYGLCYSVTNTKGEEALQKNPAVAQRSEAEKRLQYLLQEFGLSPAAVSKVKPHQEPHQVRPDNPWHNY